MPTKVIKPVDTIIYISSKILTFIGNTEKSIEDIFSYIQDSHYKEISEEKLFLCLSFLHIINKIENQNAIIKLKLK